MEEAGLAEDHDGPAPWVSNPVLAPKDNGGVRVTIDMREPNKAIQDTRHQRRGHQNRIVRLSLVL